MAPLPRGMTRTGSLPSMSELDECSPGGEAMESSDDCVKVYVRVRPFNKREISQAGPDAPIALVEQDQRSVVVQAAPPRRFRFDGAQGEDAGQEDIFQLVGQGIADGFLEGFNGTICVYGQTGAGKTYTMVGDVVSVDQMHLDPRRGLICRTLDYVFDQVQKREAAMPGVSYAFRCSFLEIYREQVTDLLDSAASNLQLREDQHRGVYVEKLTEPVISSREEAFDVLLRGLQQRRTGSTHMNERSSRSHAVFTITLEMHQARDGISSRQITRLNLVDLAGSERQMGVAELLRGGQLPGSGPTVKEASSINRSLSALTNVIMNLSREEILRRKNASSGRGLACSRSFVNYRDSKLTYLLKDSLGGNSRTAIVANISPSALCSSETLSSLKFAARAKHVQCSAVRKEEFSASVEDLMREVTTLRRRVFELENGQDSNVCAVSTGSTCSRSSWRSSCSTEEDSLVAHVIKGSKKEEAELQVRLSETKRDLFKAISQLAQVEAKLQLAAAETNDLQQEAAKMRDAKSPRIPSGISSMPGSMPGCVPVTAEAFMAGMHTETTPKKQQPPSPNKNMNYNMEPVAGAAQAQPPPPPPPLPMPSSGAASPRAARPSTTSSRPSPRSSHAAPHPVQQQRPQRPQLPMQAVLRQQAPQQVSPRLQMSRSGQFGQASYAGTPTILSARSQGSPMSKSFVPRGARDAGSMLQAVAN